MNIAQPFAKDALLDLELIYERYKQVTIWFGACAILHETSSALEVAICDFDNEASRLANVYAMSSYGPIFASFAEAATELAPAGSILVGATEHALAFADTVRLRHRTLRAKVWEFLPFEYVPCSSPAHQHDHHGASHSHG